MRQRHVLVGLVLVAFLVLVRLTVYLFSSSGVDPVHEAQLRVQAENELFTDQLHGLPTGEVLHRADLRQNECEAQPVRQGACVIFLRKIGQIKPVLNRRPGDMEVRQMVEEALIELHQDQLALRTARAHGQKGRETHRAGAVESVTAVAHVLNVG